MVSAAPPTVLSIIARWFCPWFFLPGTVISCGASIEGVSDDASSHTVVEKVRHKFPDVLQKVEILTCILFRV